MKKFLLLSCAALATVTANAQDYKMSNIDFGKTQSMAMKAITPAPQRSNMEITPALKSAVKDMSAIKNKMAKAPALSNLDGDYIEHYLGTGYSQDYTFTQAGSVSTTTQDGKKYVQLVMANGYATVVGEYDEAAGTITCGSQYVYEDTKNGWGRFVIYGIDSEDKLTEDLSFTVDDNGVITCDQAGFYIHMPEYEDGKYAWTLGYEWVISPVNGVHSFAVNQNNQGWKDITDVPVSVDDAGFFVDVYNFLSMGYVSMDVNDDCTVSMPVGQPMLPCAYISQSIDTSVYGEFFILYGTTSEDGESWGLDLEATDIKGKIEGNTLYFEQLFPVLTLLDEESAGYSMGWFGGVTISLDKDFQIAAGIEDVNNTVESKIKNAKTFNIMGQRVNSDAKGLIIRDGKKFLKK